MADIAALVAAIMFCSAISVCTLYGMHLYHVRKKEELSIRREDMQRRSELLSQAMEKGYKLPSGNNDGPTLRY